VRTLPLLALAATLSIPLSACNQTPSIAPSASAIDQSNLCEVSEWLHDDVASVCKPGQKVVFLPKTFGNEQLPIIFAAVNCDLRYGVALTQGAVTCIYGPITPKSAK
jgi:hypothetical protein